jgi:hypothetical protein
MIIDLFKPNTAGVLEAVGAVAFHGVPLTNTSGLYCTPRGIISFERAREISDHLALNEAVGTIDEYEWRRK